MSASVVKPILHNVARGAEMLRPVAPCIAAWISPKPRIADSPAINAQNAPVELGRLQYRPPNNRANAPEIWNQEKHAEGKHDKLFIKRDTKIPIPNEMSG